MTKFYSNIRECGKSVYFRSMTVTLYIPDQVHFNNIYHSKPNVSDFKLDTRFSLNFSQSDIYPQFHQLL